MRKTITKLSCAIVALLSSSSVCAQITKPSDLYGKYEFTADIELTEDGKAYADLFSAQCEVVILGDEMYDFSIAGLAGATDVQTANLRKGNLEIMSYNGSSYYLWGSPVLYGNAEGESPFSGALWNVIYIVDPETKNITVEDFTAITVNEKWSTDKVLARFTNCKLTFKEAIVLEVDDMSGEYHFTAAGTNADSTFPTECDITLTAKDDTYTEYAAVFKFGEDYKALELTASFDGSQLIIPFKDAYLNEAQTLALCNYWGSISLEDEITFSLGGSGKAFSLTSGISFCRAVQDGDEVKYSREQWFTSGAMVMPSTVTAEFAGSYHVTTAELWNMFTVSGAPDPYNYEYPQEFDVVIKYDEVDAEYCVMEFMGVDIFSANWGATVCEVDGNTLKLPVGKLLDRVYMSDDYSTMVYHVLYNGLGEPTGTIDLTVNEDGTCTMGDFFLFRETRTYDAEWNMSSEFARAAFYGTLSVTSGVDDVKATDAAKVSVANGVIYVMGEPAPVKVYSTAGALVYSGVTSTVSGLNKGMYIVKVGAAAVKVVL